MTTCENFPILSILTKMAQTMSPGLIEEARARKIIHAVAEPA
jgi:hypothetical protein